MNPSVSSQVLDGRVSVARCRAKCLATFQGDGSCDGWGCQECWTLCQHLDVSGDDQSHICHHEECQEGCQTACGFYFHSNATPKRKVEPKVASLEFSHPPSLFGCSLSWGELQVSSNTLWSSRDLLPSTSTVYLVLGQDRAGQWYEVTQTTGTRTLIDGIMTAKLDQVRVMAVREDGVKASQAFMTDGTNCEEVERLRMKAEAERTREQVEPSLKPTLEFLTSEKIFSEATLTWTEEPVLQQPGSPGSRFLIQWHQVPDNYLVVGSLHTSSNTLRLSLQPDTFYVVEIHDQWAKKVSPPTIINTTIRHKSREVSWELVIVLGVTALAVLSFGGILLNMRSTREPIRQDEQNTSCGDVETCGDAPCIKEIAGEEVTFSPMVSSHEDIDEEKSDWNVSIWVSSIMSGLKQSLRSARLPQPGDTKVTGPHAQEV